MANININKFLFSRTAPAKKIEVIENLDESELWRITDDTFRRIIKEAGQNLYKSKNKEMRLTHCVGNNWNSEVECIGYWGRKKDLTIDFYVQYGDCETDTTMCEDFAKFNRRGNFRGEIPSTDRHGNPRTWYYNYDEEDKEDVFRAILLSYVEIKYHDKLKKQ